MTCLKPSYFNWYYFIEVNSVLLYPSEDVPSSVHQARLPSRLRPIILPISFSDYSMGQKAWLSLFLFSHQIVN